MIVDEPVASGAQSRALSHRSVLASSNFAAHRVTRRLPSPGPSPGAAQDQQVVGDDPEAHPALHPEEASIAAASEPVAALQGADASFAAGSPFQRGANGAGAPLPALPRQDHPTHAPSGRGPLIGGRGKAAVGNGQEGGAAEELLVPNERGDPERLIGHTGRADRVVGDELGLGFLDLHQLAELRRLDRLAFADRLRVRLEEAEELIRVVGIPSDDPRAGLGEHAPDAPGGLAQLLRERCQRPLGPPDGLHRPSGHLLRGRLGLPDDRRGAAHELAVEGAHPTFTGSRFACRLSCAIAKTRWATLRVRSRSRTTPCVAAVRSRLSVRVRTRTPSARSRAPRTTRRWRARPTSRSTSPVRTAGPRQWLSRMSVLASGTRSPSMRQNGRYTRLPRTSRSHSSKDQSNRCFRTSIRRTTSAGVPRRPRRRLWGWRRPRASTT